MGQDKESAAIDAILLDKIHVEKFYLREATIADAELLYQWRNDVTVRQYAFHSEPVEFAEHLRWLEKTLADRFAHLFIMVNDIIPIGQIRVNQQDEEYVVSYSIDEHFRGHALGRHMLTLLVQWMKAKVGHGILAALVKKENLASQHTFEKLGYQRTEEHNFYRYTKRF
mgnify:CR=1 FL=1